MCNFGNGNGCCSWIILLIIVLCCCGGNNGGVGLWGKKKLWLRLLIKHAD